MSFRRGDSRDPNELIQSLHDSLTDRSQERDWFYTAPRAEWAKRLGVLVDGNVLEFETHKYLPDIYNDESNEIVFIKAAQMGASIYGMVKMLQRSAALMPFNTGYYLPTQDKTNEFSQLRFDPLCDGIPRIVEMRNRSTVWRAGAKRLGASNMYFSYTEGRVSTESTPLDGLIFDEVRRMSRAKIELIQERVSHSRYKYIDYISTAGYPGSDIHWYWLQSDQHEWWVRCPDCRRHFLPHEQFPRHVERRVTATGTSKWGLVCPSCNGFDIDPQGDGCHWRIGVAGMSKRGYHLTQLFSKYISLDAIMHQFHTTDDIAEFHRSKLGIPYLDPNTIIVQPQDLIACIDVSEKWGVQFPMQENGVREGFDKVITVMGIDQQPQHNIVVVKELTPSGVPILRHLEYVYDKRPFRRCAELMREYDVNGCVADRAPNFNDSEEFARAFPGRVWLASYGSSGSEMASWHDNVKKGDLPNYEEDRAPHHVTVNRVAGLEKSLMRFRLRQNRIPNPDYLVQQVRPKDLVDPLQHANIIGTMVDIPICKDLFFEHLQRVAKVRVATTNEAGAEVVADARYRFDHIGVDPHFAHANLYTDVAMSRLQKYATGLRTAAGVWYADEELSVEEKIDREWREKLVEFVPGVKVAPYDPATVDPTEVDCVQCGLRYYFVDTRAIQKPQGQTARCCVNCLSGAMGGPQSVQPLPAKKSFKERRAERRMREYDKAHDRMTTVDEIEGE